MGNNAIDCTSVYKLPNQLLRVMDRHDDRHTMDPFYELQGESESKQLLPAERQI